MIKKNIFLTWHTLHEFNVLLNRISTSSWNSLGSFLTQWGIVTIDESPPWTKSLNLTLSKHYKNQKRKRENLTIIRFIFRTGSDTWLISLIQAAFSCMVNAYKWTVSGCAPFFSITSLKSWCWGHVINDCSDCDSQILLRLPFLCILLLLAWLCVHTDIPTQYRIIPVKIPTDSKRWKNFN